MKLKKLSLALYAALLACTPVQQMQEVTFHAQLVETGSMTRATDHNEILGLIESTYVSFPVDLYTNEETNTYTRMEFGRSYTVPVGTFRVTGYSTPETIGQPASNYRLAKTPLFYTSSYVTIQYGTAEYALPVEIRSAAIVIDRNEVSKVEFKGQTGSYITMTDSDFTYSDNYGVFFINGTIEGQNKVCFQVTPKTGANKVTEFFLCAVEVATGSATYAKLEGGKYYVLHPNPVTELSGVSFTMDVPAWECGLE